MVLKGIYDSITKNSITSNFLEEKKRILTILIDIFSKVEGGLCKRETLNMFVRLGFYEGYHRNDDKAAKIDRLNESCNQVDDSWFYEYHHDSLKSRI